MSSTSLYPISMCRPEQNQKEAKYSCSVECRNGFKYSRAVRNREDGNFRDAEVPPFHARFSDEDHFSCTHEDFPLLFSKDMRSVTQNLPFHTAARANVFAREGSYYYETKLLSQSVAGMETQQQSLNFFDKAADREVESVEVGSTRIGFARREHHLGYPPGASFYSYGLKLVGGHAKAFGSVLFGSEMYKTKGQPLPEFQRGDVIGLMITLPSLEIQKKVVDGTYVPEKPVAAPKKGKKGKKPKEPVTEPEPVPSSEQSNQQELNTNSVNDIVRFRYPILAGPGTKACYHESVEYTLQEDLRGVHAVNSNAHSKGNPVKAPDQNKMIRPNLFPRPNEARVDHPLPHFRTLPGSKIEIWVNGRYLGIVWEDLLAFLPPASYLEDPGAMVEVNKTKGKRKKAERVFVDDGSLGYYPCVSVYGGGASACRFKDFWYGIPKDRPEARPFEDRYAEQAVEDILATAVDEAAWALGEGV